MIKAVLFDFDETLQDRTEAFEGYMDVFMQDFLPDLSDAEKVKRKQDMVDTGNGGYVDRESWYQDLIDMWEWKDAPAARELAYHYDSKFGFCNVIFDGSLPLLKELRKKGLKTGVITNGPTLVQQTKMEQSGLMPYCDIVVVSGNLPFAKPDCRIFEYTAEKLGLKTNECMYVGDHPVNDIAGAKLSGMQAIRMNWGWFENADLRPDVPVITNIYDVLKYV